MSKLTFYPLTISAIKPETPSSISVSFAVPEELAETFTFIPGQYLTLRCEIDGLLQQRAYSICSSIADENLVVGIKRVQNGVFSNHANDNFKVGTKVEVAPPQGNFTVDLDETQQKNYMCIAAGSGITPILAILKSILLTEPRSRATLIYGNKNSQSVMFKEDLGFLKNRYMDRLVWINIMDHEDQGYELGNGIIDNKKGSALHKSGLINIHAVDDVFICGPESMMSEVSRGFRASGLDADRIHYELFATSSEDVERILEKSQQRIAEYGEEKTSEVTITAGGRSIKITLAAVGENILDAGIHNGLDLPYACKAGVCATCKAKVVKGKVEMNLTHGLEQHEIDDGLILACQAHPVTDEVEVDFDKR